MLKVLTVHSVLGVRVLFFFLSVNPTENVVRGRWRAVDTPRRSGPQQRCAFGPPDLPGHEGHRTFSIRRGRVQTQGRHLWPNLTIRKKQGVPRKMRVTHIQKKNHIAHHTARNSTFVVKQCFTDESSDRRYKSHLRESLYHWFYESTALRCSNLAKQILYRSTFLWQLFSPLLHNLPSLKYSVHRRFEKKSLKKRCNNRNFIVALWNILRKWSDLYRWSGVKTSFTLEDDIRCYYTVIDNVAYKNVCSVQRSYRLSSNWEDPMFQNFACWIIFFKYIVLSSFLFLW